MATLSRSTAQLTNFLAICRKGKACQRLVFARNAHFTYVPDTPLKEYGMTLCFACISTRSFILNHFLYCKQRVWGIMFGLQIV